MGRLSRDIEDGMVDQKAKEKFNKEIGLDSADYIVDGMTGDTLNAPIRQKMRKRKKIMKYCFVFALMFLLSLAAGIYISKFMGPGGILPGLGIGAAIGFVVAIVPLIVLLIVNRKNY